MSKHSTFLAAILSAGLLLSGCSHAPLPAGVNRMPLHAATVKSTTAPFGHHLVIKSVSTRNVGNWYSPDELPPSRVFQVSGSVDGGKPYGLELHTLRPYYLPLFKTATINGRFLKLNKNTALALLTLLNSADKGDTNTATWIEMLGGLSRWAGSAPDFPGKPS